MNNVQQMTTHESADELVEFSDIQLLLKQFALSTVMSEMEESSAIIELESIAQQQVLKKRALAKAVKPAVITEAKVEPKPVAVPEKKPENRQEPARPKPAAPPASKETRDLVRKHEAERKMLERNMKDREKKSERDIKTLMEQVLKEHYAQVDKERADYVAVLRELKNALEGQSKQVVNTCQQVVTSATQQEVERLVSWFHDEFISELDKKSREYEELKTTSEEQVNKMTAENDGKSQKIMMMDEKIKELATQLPEDIRKEIFEELGLQHLEIKEESVKEEKRESKGLFSRLSGLFKGPPTKKTKSVKSKQAKGQNKRAQAEKVIAR